MRALTTIAAVAIGVMLLSGCLPQQPTAPPPPEPTAAPIFASDEEALAAATAAYAAYVKLADQVFVEGGTDPERLAKVATGNFAAASIAGFEDIEKKGWRSTGGTTFDGVTLQRLDPTSGAEAVMTVYLCEDVSEVDVVDSVGVSVVSLNRPPRTLLEVTFDRLEQSLLVSSREPWGDKSC